MKTKTVKWVVATLASVVLVCVVTYLTVTRFNFSATERGTIVDSLDSVYVYYNGGVNQSSGRNVIDGYNIGIKYQCVEFVKRYYYEHYNHRMPDTYGHAKDFFDSKLKNGEINVKRNLTQYTNGDGSKPQKGDIIVFGPYIFNPYGHVAIIAQIGDDWIEVIQQNYGFGSTSRERFELQELDNGYTVQNSRVLGWLRK